MSQTDSLVNICLFIIISNVPIPEFWLVDEFVSANQMWFSKWELFRLTNQKHRNKHIDWNANQITAFISSSQFIIVFFQVKHEKWEIENSWKLTTCWTSELVKLESLINAETVSTIIHFVWERNVQIKVSNSP